MAEDMSFRAEKFLSAAIFVLWSVGVVVIPTIRESISSSALISIRLLYLLLQLVLLAFGLYLLGSVTAAAFHKSRLRRYLFWRAVLYIYVVGMLVVSIGFGFGMLLTV